MGTIKIISAVAFTTLFSVCALTGAAVLGVGLGAYLWLLIHGFLELVR